MATGKVVQVIGTVVDIEFPADELPNLFDALELDNVGEKLVLEVQQQRAYVPAAQTLPFPPECTGRYYRRRAAHPGSARL